MAVTEHGPETLLRVYASLWQHADCRNQVPLTAVAETWPKPKSCRKSFLRQFQRRNGTYEAVAEIRSGSVCCL